MRLFRVHSQGIVAAVTVLHIAIFAIMYTLLSSQRAGVDDLNNAGVYVGKSCCTS